MKYRIEKDTMGEVKVPADKLWGAQTERSRTNFKIGPPASMPLEIVYGFAYLKKAAAYTNCELGVLTEKKRDLIATVCDEILKGEHDSQFPLVIWQTGSGTQSNMNVNEVIANRAHQLAGKIIGEGEKTLLPNDDVNKSQSSNDTFPTGMHIAAYKKLIEVTIPGVQQLQTTLLKKAGDFKNVVKIGRTHLMDATPLTLGQEFSGYASQLEHGLNALQNTLTHLSELALGGTAVGTGINTPKGYATKVAEYISKFTELPFITATNKFEALAAHDAIVESHGALKQLAVSLNKIANDIRMLSSGPRSGIGEISLPANEPGSSIMPGKVNPVLAEMMNQAMFQVIGNDVTVMMSGQAGQLELNVMMPIIAYNLFQSMDIIINASNAFTEKCVVGIEANAAKATGWLAKNAILVTALNPVIGYAKGAEVAKEAMASGRTVREVVLEKGYLTADQADQLLDVRVLTEGGIRS